MYRCISFYLFLFFVCLSTLASSSSALLGDRDGEGELQLVVVVTRHGSRTPYTIMPQKVRAKWTCKLNPVSTLGFGYSHAETAPVNRLYRQQYIAGREPLQGNCSQGQLTTEGAHMHYLLGQRFRGNYVETGFLPKRFNDSRMYIRATDVVRTIQSAQAQMLGLYPPIASPSGGPEIVSINTLEASVETMKPNNCPRLVQHCNEAQKTSEWQHRLAGMQDLRHLFEKAWDAPATDIPWWIGLWNEFEARLFHNMTQPPLVSEKVVAQVGTLVAWQMGALYGNNTNGTVASMTIGVFLDELLSVMSSAVDNIPNQPKFRLYSGHDITVGPLLNALGIYDYVWPKYASNIVFEVRTYQGKNFVKVIYNDKVKVLPYCNDELCEFNLFRDYLSKIAITSTEKEALCATPNPVKPEGDPSAFLCN